MIIKTQLHVGTFLEYSRVDNTPIVEITKEELEKLDITDYTIIDLENVSHHLSYEDASILASEILNYPPSVKVRGFEETVLKKNAIDTTLPTRGSKQSAGYDFYSKETIDIQPSKSYLFWSDVKAYMLPGEVLELYVRSSVGIKKGLVLANTVGIVDCVPAGTMIKTEDGEIEVEKLLDEEKIILSYNEETKEIENDELKDIFTVDYDELIQIETEEGDIVEIPENKEIYTERGWIKAKELNINDTILKF